MTPAEEWDELAAGAGAGDDFEPPTYSERLARRQYAFEQARSFGPWLGPGSLGDLRLLEPTAWTTCHGAAEERYGEDVADRVADALVNGVWAKTWGLTAMAYEVSLGHHDDAHAEWEDSQPTTEDMQAQWAQWAEWERELASRN